ncbi:hypothetical protein GGX14DRAFT_397479 [Mycena pura]|uniref:Uncharacterized protein n=1 Tax=Mycena pura TaxID=153505 RepID=A0AAD6VFM7_9AGAR|nr:hypothetical protein GGX14DRAFT_397479 [Mycena pura]
MAQQFRSAIKYDDGIGVSRAKFGQPLNFEPELGVQYSSVQHSLRLREKTCGVAGKKLKKAVEKKKEEKEGHRLGSKIPKFRLPPDLSSKGIIRGPLQRVRDEHAKCYVKSSNFFRQTGPRTVQPADIERRGDPSATLQTWPADYGCPPGSRNGYSGLYYQGGGVHERAHGLVNCEGPPPNFLVILRDLLGFISGGGLTRITPNPEGLYLSGWYIWCNYVYLTMMYPSAHMSTLVTECQDPRAPQDGITNCLKQTLTLEGNRTADIKPCVEPERLGPIPAVGEIVGRPRFLPSRGFEVNQSLIATFPLCTKFNESIQACVFAIKVLRERDRTSPGPQQTCYSEYYQITVIWPTGHARR